MHPAARTTIKHILRRLAQAYGPRPWKCWGNAVSVLVDTILSQNTSNANSNAGYRQLRRRFPRWEQVAAAPVEEVERCIRVSGLSRLKAPRIQNILRQIKEQRGRIDLQHLRDMKPREALDYLRGFKGVGPKTANCTLLFSFNHAVFPVDTHIHRIALRIGLIPRGTSADEAHDRLLPLIAPGDHYAAHVLLIEHGRRVCKARNPKCGWCPLMSMCRYGKKKSATNEHE